MSNTDNKNVPADAAAQGEGVEPANASSATATAVPAFLEPQIALPAVGFVILLLIWGFAYQLIRIERSNVQDSASVLTTSVADLYETQVLRALREIDQTLKLVKYAYEKSGDMAVLTELRNKDMLPTEQVFRISITDPRGRVIASSHAAEAAVLSNDNFFQQPLNQDAIAVGQPHRNNAGEWVLEFSRRLQGNEGSFAGIVWITVNADYFVSGYEEEKLGRQGMLGLVGADGVFRVRRSGNLIETGDAVDYAALLAQYGGEVSGAVENGWDNVSRYTAVHPLYGFPVAIVVGISEQDQLADIQKTANYYLKSASIATVVCAVILILLWELLRNRRLAQEERLEHAKRVEYLAYHDGLTGLPNRSLLAKLQTQVIAQARRYNHQAAFFFLDLDGFKQVNDELGHNAGDQLLQEVALRLQDCLRQSDTVARLGGDEFVILLPEVKSRRHISEVALKILVAIARPYRLMGTEAHVTASIGIAIFPRDGLDEQTLAKNADIAMYRAKDGGKNKAVFFSDAGSAA